jgi:hypothetical protein
MRKSRFTEELKGALGIGQVPSQVFDANHTAFLLKLLGRARMARAGRLA